MWLFLPGQACVEAYGVLTIGRLPKMLGLFRERDLFLVGLFCKRDLILSIQASYISGNEVYSFKGTSAQGTAVSFGKEPYFCRDLLQKEAEVCLLSSVLLENIARDDEALDLACAFVNLCDARVSVVPLHGVVCHVSCVCVCVCVCVRERERERKRERDRKRERERECVCVPS